MIRRTLAAALALAAGSVLLTGCGSGDAASAEVGVGNAGTKINIGPDQHRVRGTEDPRSAALVPAAVRRTGELRIGVGAESSPPLSFYATDDKTLIGVEEDLATLVADTLGLKPHFEPLSWENLFVGLDSGKLDAVFGNVTVTEERKDKYDFATYRLDQLAMETKKGSGWKVRGAADVAGRTIAVGSGTNQEKILLDWSKEDERAGRKPVDVKYFQKPSDVYLALQSGRIDGYFGPNPTVAYHIATAGGTESAGTFSGGGAHLKGEIAATTRKGSGLVGAYAAALRKVIDDGRYAKVLARWGLSGEAVTTSRINPPGLPRTAD
ncbi:MULTISPECIES: ABC transporter substrate-binding protein [Streptomyces]|uniref:ABC transporter substrate-binding protein n=1 Tax=Streptomyces TaxID=1883 RepID=UPI0019633157|nr:MULTISPECIES: ABC transporter substrate-binding protein [Streptomyces]QRX91497.1 ABC transporter substrate-binding protein [Streptomyces noursei]UJB41270.1 ABC transporter substrate-binding protein [Streptomyces sp. A1-5]